MLGQHGARGRRGCVRVGGPRPAGLDPGHALGMPWAVAGDQQQPTRRSRRPRAVHPDTLPRRGLCPGAADGVAVPGQRGRGSDDGGDAVNGALPSAAGARRGLDAEWLREWDRARNAPLDPRQVSGGSSRVVWWRCTACGHGWAARVSSRSRGQGCPRCRGCPECARRRGKRPRGSLAEERPDLVEQSWDGERNRDVSPQEVTCGSQRKAWWRCPLGHRWRAAVAERVRGAGCPRCAGHYDDSLSVTHPQLAAEWDEQANTRPASRVTAGSPVVAAWRCGHGHAWRAAVSDRVKGS